VSASNVISPAANQNFTITVNQAPAFTSGAPPANGTTATAYSFTFEASGYPAPTFSVTGGNFPPGLNLSSAGVITGTPTTDGVFTFTITASNGVTPDASQSYTITIADLASNTDTPTMPPWGLALLAALLILAAAKSMPRPSTVRGISR
jgi:hypothetical protein